jgi:predicted short-subunit dehydrogenase-like oxidoreductase (DUF2520 family)
MIKDVEKVSIVGSGNMANFWAQCFFNHNLPIHSVVSRNQEKGEKLAQEYGTTWRSDFPIYEHDVLVLLCVSDDAIALLSEEINCRCIAHCSGAVSIEVLKKHPSYYVIYPLQTLSAHASFNIQNLPLLIEAKSENETSELQKWLSPMDFNTQIVSSSNRLKYHVSAVFANNFTNALLLMTEDYCHQQGLDFNLLKPLFKETCLKLESHTPFQAQTGPAKRNDLKTIHQHLNLLKDEKQMSEIYQLISDFIRKRF